MKGYQAAQYVTKQLDFKHVTAKSLSSSNDGLEPFDITRKGKGMGSAERIMSLVTQVYSRVVSRP